MHVKIYRVCSIFLILCCVFGFFQIFSDSRTAPSCKESFSDITGGLSSKVHHLYSPEKRGKSRTDLLNDYMALSKAYYAPCSDTDIPYDKSEIFVCRDSHKNTLFKITLCDEKNIILVQPAADRFSKSTAYTYSIRKS